MRGWMDLTKTTGAGNLSVSVMTKNQHQPSDFFVPMQLVVFNFIDVPEGSSLLIVAW
jgi:hypothetical protein